MSSLRRLGPMVILGLALPIAAPAAPGSTPIVGCPSLVNLRMLMRDSKLDMAAAAKQIGNDATDHFGCVVLERGDVLTLQEHLTLNGNAYDCITLRSTRVCHWVIAGSVTFGDAPPKGRADRTKHDDKSKPGEKAAVPEKARR